MNKFKTLFVFFLIVTLISCDTMVIMPYTVENKTIKNVRLFIPNYPTNNTPHPWSIGKDTTLTLKPTEKIIISIGRKIDFPWGRKNIYRNNPGICGLRIIQKDTTIKLGCSKSEWKYKKGESNMKLK